MIARFRRAKRGDDGASAVEFALVLLPLILIVFGIVSFGALFAQQLALNNGVRQGARLAVVEGSSSTAKSCAGVVSGVRDASTPAMAMPSADINVKVVRSASTPCGTGTNPTSTTPAVCQNSISGTTNVQQSIVVTATYPAELLVPLPDPRFPQYLRPVCEGGVQMRVQLREREQGAVAVIVAVLATLLLGLAAFAVDFGQAYAVKRQLSVAADASALDAARAVATTKIGNNPILGGGKGCATWTSAERAAAENAAQGAAEDTNANNDLSGNSTVDLVTVTCVGNDRVEVDVENSRELDALFAQLLGCIGA